MKSVFRILGLLTSDNTARTKARGAKDRSGCGHRGDYEWDADHSADG